MRVKWECYDQFLEIRRFFKKWFSVFWCVYVDLHTGITYPYENDVVKEI